MQRDTAVPMESEPNTAFQRQQRYAERERKQKERDQKAAQQQQSQTIIQQLFQLRQELVCNRTILSGPNCLSYQNESKLVSAVADRRRGENGRFLRDPNIPLTPAQKRKDAMRRRNSVGISSRKKSAIMKLALAKKRAASEESLEAPPPKKQTTAGYHLFKILVSNMSPMQDPSLRNDKFGPVKFAPRGNSG